MSYILGVCGVIMCWYCFVCHCHWDMIRFSRLPCSVCPGRILRKWYKDRYDQCPSSASLHSRPTPRGYVYLYMYGNTPLTWEMHGVWKCINLTFKLTDCVWVLDKKHTFLKILYEKIVSHHSCATFRAMYWLRCSFHPCCKISQLKVRSTCELCVVMCNVMLLVLLCCHTFSFFFLVSASCELYVVCSEMWW